MKEMARAVERGLGKPSTATCPECGSRFRRELVLFRIDGQLLGSFPADVCGDRHEYFTEAGGAAIKNTHPWPLGMELGMGLRMPGSSG